MSLNSVVNKLMRAAASVPEAISDADLDAHVAKLLSEEARANDAKWSELGLGAYLNSGGSSGNGSRDSPDPNAPKPSKRFLSSIIRAVDGHNASLLRQQAQAARDARSARDPPRRDDRAGANRLFGGAMRGLGGTSGRDRDRQRERDRDPERARERRRDDSRDRDERDFQRNRDRDARRRRDRSHSRSSSPAVRHSSRDDRERRRRRDDDADEEQRRSRRRREDDRDDDDVRERRRSRDRDVDRDQCDNRRERRRHRDEDRRRREWSKDADERRDRDRERERDRERRRYKDRSRSPRRRSVSPRRPSSQPQIAPRSRGTADTCQPREPSSSPPPPPSRISRMDKYFKRDYDPRLDVGEVPKTGPVTAVGWDSMLAVLKDRGKKRRRNSPTLSSSPEPERKARSIGPPKVSVPAPAAPAEEKGLLDMEYTRRGETRAWDVGKEAD